MNDLVSKGVSGAGGNSPIGAAEILTVAGLTAVGVFSWSVTVPANERWLLIGMQTVYNAGSSSTSARILRIDLPGGNIYLTYYPNIDESYDIQCGVGLEDRVQLDLTLPDTGHINMGLPADTWLNPGDVVGMSGVTFDPDTVWQFNEVRVIKYAI